ncbi:hypothetical protein SAMN05192533_109189 [Mesobacillus persicus]|uniref:Uncharacterized protein n=1 Tax=Mesobacillus persicus TaxID=930146 RepID=A0A1H8E747_9BACI|nr:hypothetical protein [Mesobacillus persicus]SEN15391.1 hypothetical protein SAMN05192533_109189 [Mesobacillus persicus]
MKQKMNVIQAELIERELLLHTETETNLSQLSPVGQMLVDSDQLAFIYIVDLDGEYTYVTIPVESWKVLSEAIVIPNLQVYLVNKESRLKLQAFIEEMTYLIENIKGNSNYGAEMVEKVETIF